MPKAPRDGLRKDLVQVRARGHTEVCWEAVPSIRDSKGERQLELLAGARAVTGGGGGALDLGRDLLLG